MCYRIFGALIVASLIAVLGVAYGQDDRKSASNSYPTRVVKLVVPFGPGSGADILGRLIADKLSRQWPYSVIVENRAGATGRIAAEYVAKSAPDGYTLLLGNIATHGVDPALFKGNLHYDPLGDFVPVIMLAKTTLALVVLPSFPAKTMPELIALAKAQPGKLNYASAGVGSGSHMPMELLKLATGIDIVHVPYKGSGDALIALLAGDVSMAFTGPLSVLQFIKAGKLRAIGVTSTKRAATLPDVPTISETVDPGYEADLWFGVLAPAQTPNSVVMAINAAINSALQASDVKARMRELDLESAGGAPEQFTDFIKMEITKWTKVINASGIKP